LIFLADPHRSSPRLPAEVIEMAVALKRENMDRTAAQVRRILRAQMGWSPGERTLQRHFAQDPLIVAQLGAVAAGGPDARAVFSPGVFGRFEAERTNELWTGDALRGPRVGGRKTYLFAFLDDHSRAIVGHRFGFAEDTVRLAAALRPALGSRGVPESVYVDNGSAFVDWLLRACAKLAIKLIHSTPGRPQGRGKIERFFRTVREQFLVEITGEIGEPSGDSIDGGAGAEAFCWEAHRTVTKTATVSLLDLLTTNPAENHPAEQNPAGQNPAEQNLEVSS
jgi:putative transposase